MEIVDRRFLEMETRLLWIRGRSRREDRSKQDKRALGSDHGASVISGVLGRFQFLLEICGGF
jgi:hypothetical protein